MSRKHYRAFARMLHNSSMEDYQREALAIEMSRVFAADNSNFDRQRFMTAVMTGEGC